MRWMGGARRGRWVEPDEVNGWSQKGRGRRVTAWAGGGGGGGGVLVWGRTFGCVGRVCGGVVLLSQLTLCK